MIGNSLRLLGALAILVVAGAARAELPWQFDQHTRYMALGDSLAAGYGAVPATQGYVYLLYQGGVFDNVPNTLLCNAGVPGADSGAVLQYQVPQAIQVFRPQVITVTVGGNDLLQILSGADPNAVLGRFSQNLYQILYQLRVGLPDARIVVSNQYTVSDIPGADATIPVFNAIVEDIAGRPEINVPVADVYGAFYGRKGLLLIERHGAGQYEAHPTNAGYRAIADAFRAAFGR